METGISREELRAALMRHGTMTGAAEELGVSRRSIGRRMKKLAIPHSILQSTPRKDQNRSDVDNQADSFVDRASRAIDYGFEAPYIPSSKKDVEEIIHHLCNRFEKRVEEHAAKAWMPFKIKFEGPLGLVFVGDPHIDDSGCNWPELLRDIKIMQSTDGLFGVGIGDYTNNWSGVLAQKKSPYQETSRTEAWQLAEWFFKEVPWMMLLKGNHDCVSEDTELFTRRGWVTYDQISVKDEVRSINTETGEVEWTHINSIIVKDFEGELNYYGGDVELLCTDKHRILLRTHEGLRYFHAEAIPAATFPYEEGGKVKFTSTVKREKVPYTGKVWCLSVPNENFMVRRNGKVHFTGNCWSNSHGTGDPLDFMYRGAARLEEWQARFTVELPSGRDFRVWAAHDFAGNSMWNNLHSPMKAAKMSAGMADIYACGHKHNWGMMNHELPDNNKVYWALRTKGYKHIDDYAERLGYMPQNYGASITAIIDPEIEGPGYIQCYASTEEAAEYLTWKRKRWEAQKSSKL